jgi:hypothetical protein
MTNQPRRGDKRAFWMIARKMAVNWRASEISASIMSGSIRRLTAINRSQNNDSRDSFLAMANLAMKSAFV